jgi:transient receptor potential cation channel subfamily C
MFSIKEYAIYFLLKFVSHPNVQQLLAAIWYDGLPGFRRKSMFMQLLEVAKLGAMFPIYSCIYMMAPTSQMGLFMKKPFVKFICHSASYAFFLSKANYRYIDELIWYYIDY